MRATTGDYVHPGNGYRLGYRGLNIYTLVDRGYSHCKLICSMQLTGTYTLLIYF